MFSCVIFEELFCLTGTGGGWDNTPIRLFTAGNTVVRILFTLSGFVLSYKYIVLGKNKGMETDIVKRYFRLAPPIIVANLLVYFLMKMGFLYNIEAGKISGSDTFLSLFNNFTPNLIGCLKEAVGTCYFQGANGYIGPLWTIKYEFLGSILVLCVICICHNSVTRNFFYCFYLLFYYNSYYSYFVIGMLISDLYSDKLLNNILKKHKCFNNVLFCAGIWIVSMTDISDAFSYIFFGFGLIIFFITLLNSSWGEMILGNKIMRKYGSLSYSVYILHWPVIESFSSAFYLWTNGKGINHEIAIVFNLFFSIIIISLLAFLFNKYIERMGNGAIEYIGKYFNKLDCGVDI